jgi:hypothetical protein
LDLIEQLEAQVLDGTPVLFLLAALLSACSEAPPVRPPVDADTTSSAPSQVAIATDTVDQQQEEIPAYSGRDMVEINSELYRVCDGKSGRMIFVYHSNEYKQSRGGVAILTGQGECQ